MVQQSVDFPIYGIWYPLNDPTIKVRGILEQPDSEQTLLKLYCLSDEECNAFKSANTIYGIDSLGQKISLLECFEVNRSHNGNGNCNVSIDIFTNYTLVGAHVPDTQFKKFKSICLSSSTINNWVSGYYFKKKSSICSDLIYECMFCDEKFKFAVKTEKTGSYGLLSESKEINFPITIAQTTDAEISIVQSFRMSFPFLYLVPFLCDQDHGCRFIALELSGNKHAQLYFHDKHISKDKAPHPMDILGLGDLLDHLPLMLTHWYMIYKECLRMAMLYRYTLSAECKNLEDIIASYVRILEAMLGQEFYTVSDDDNKALLDVTAAIECVSDDALRGGLQRSICWGKKKSLSKIIQDYSKSKLKHEDCYKYIKRSLMIGVSVRHDETHLKPFYVFSEKEYIQRQFAEVALLTLIKIQLLEKLGVSAEEVFHLYENHGQFRANRRAFQDLGERLESISH